MKKIVILLLALVVVLFVAKDFVIKAAVSKGVELVTGCKLNIGGLKIGILKPVVDIRDLRLLNPSNFTDRTMVDVPEIYVNYDLQSIMKGVVHLPELRLALKEFVVVRNARGELNLDALKTVQANKEGKKPEEKPGAKMPQIKIDSMTLKIGTVIFKDYSKGGQPEVKEFKINLSESYTNVDNPYTLANLIVVKALANTSIASLTGFDLNNLKGSVTDVLSGATREVTSVVDTAKDLGKGAVDSVKGLFQ